MVIEASFRVSQSPELFKAFQSALLDPTIAPEEHRSVSLFVNEAAKAGAGLDTEGKQKLQAIKQELAALSSSFGRFRLDSRKSWRRSLSSEDIGLFPQSMLSIFERTGDSYFATLSEPVIQAVLKHHPLRELREDVYRAHNQVASFAPHDNKPTIQRILELRHQSALLLSHPSYAALSLSLKMAGSPAAVQSLIDELSGMIC